jgi:hypothetical protein
LINEKIAAGLQTVDENINGPWTASFSPSNTRHESEEAHANISPGSYGELNSSK